MRTTALRVAKYAVIGGFLALMAAQAMHKILAEAGLL